MKKFYLTLFASIIFSAFSQAQKATVGFQTGLSFSTTNMKYDGDKLDTKPLAGLNTGVFLDVWLSDHLSIQPGINYVQKGSGSTYNYFDGSEEKETVRLHYLELPVNLVYYNQPGHKGFFAGGGVALGVALGGKAKYSSNGEKTEEKIEIGVNEDQLKRGDIGVNLMTGYAWNNGLFVGLNATLGLSNLSNMEGAEFRNNYFGIKFGFLLGQKH